MPKVVTDAFSTKSLQQVNWQLHYTLEQNHFKLSKGVAKGNVPSICLFIRKSVHVFFLLLQGENFLSSRCPFFPINPKTFAKEKSWTVN